MRAVVILVLGVWGVAVGDCSPVAFPGRPSEQELECFSQEKIYDRETDKCYKLLTTGPCPRGHWFVLEKPRETLRGDSEATIRGVCVRENCRDGEYYWPSTNSCVKGSDRKRLCGDVPGLELLTNVFGEGECACARDPPRARLQGDRKTHCYLLYSRGPCPAAQVLGFVGSSDQPSCIPDPCYAETLYRKRNRTLSKDAMLAAWENGTCYELGTQGPCPEGLTFKVHSSYMKPACVSLTNSLFQLEKSRNCFEDEEGRCQKVIRFSKNQTAVNYRKDLFKRFVGARRRRTAKRAQKNAEREVHARYKRPNCGALLNHIFGGMNGCEKDENGVCQKKVAQRKRSTADRFMNELQEVLSKKRRRRRRRISERGTCEWGDGAMSGFVDDETQLGFNYT